MKTSGQVINDEPVPKTNASLSGTKKGNKAMRASDFVRGEKVEYKYTALDKPYSNRGVVADVRSDRLSVQWSTGSKSVFFHPLPANLTKDDHAPE